VGEDLFCERGDWELLLGGGHAAQRGTRSSSEEKGVSDQQKASPAVSAKKGDLWKTNLLSDRCRSSLMLQKISQSETKGAKGKNRSKATPRRSTLTPTD